MNIKRTIAVLLCIAMIVLSGCAAQQPAAENGRAAKVGQTETIHGEEYVLTFLDEFDGEQMNRRNWETCPEWERADRGGKWDADMAWVEDGKLILNVMYDEEGGCYKSGAVRTYRKFEQAYGYYEISMRVQEAHGFWSAFWMMCGDVHNVDGSAKDGVELDIAEAFDVEGKGFNYALHWDGYGSKHQTTVRTDSIPAVYDGQFHTFAVRWAPEGYTWYVDGEVMWELKTEDACTQPGYMKVTTEVGSWAGEIDPEELPDRAEVEYVRAYQFAGMEAGK